MTPEEIRLQRLSNQHLLSKTDTVTVAKDLCGLQAQFLSHAHHALALRSDADTGQLIKSWTLRGTLHLFAEEDLPLFLHEGRTHFLRPQDTMESDSRITGARKIWFSQLILDAIRSGTHNREALKLLCRANGMTDAEETSMFDPWGGILRALCESGKICHRASQEKAYRICPEFTPMDRDAAHLELARRYFTHFGPATVKDAAYFLGWTQKEVKCQLARLSPEYFSHNNRIFYQIPQDGPRGKCPSVLFLAGFDQLMLGYEKTESLFLPSEHLRDIFTLSGIVRPALLIDGSVSGHWNLKNGKLSVTLFSPSDPAAIRDAAQHQWPDLRKMEFA